MVTEYGMSSLGPINFGDAFDVINWRQYREETQLSQNTLAQIDNEVRAIILDAYKNAQTLLHKNRKKLDEVAHILLDKENLDQEAFEGIMQPKKK